MTFCMVHGAHIADPRVAKARKVYREQIGPPQNGELDVYICASSDEGYSSNMNAVALRGLNLG